MLEFTRDTVIIHEDNIITFEFDVEEGNRYFFGNIDFLGNAAYTDYQLSTVLDKKRGTL